MSVLVAVVEVFLHLAYFSSMVSGSLKTAAYRYHFHSSYQYLLASIHGYRSLDEKVWVEDLFELQCFDNLERGGNGACTSHPRCHLRHRKPIADRIAWVGEREFSLALGMTVLSTLDRASEMMVERHAAWHGVIVVLGA